MKLTNREQEIVNTINETVWDDAEKLRIITSYLTESPPSALPEKGRLIIIIKKENVVKPSKICGFVRYANDIGIEMGEKIYQDGSISFLNFYPHTDYTWHSPETPKEREYRYKDVEVAWSENGLTTGMLRGSYKKGFDDARETTIEPVKISAEVQETADIIDKATKPKQDYEKELIHQLKVKINTYAQRLVLLGEDDVEWEITDFISEGKDKP